MNLIKELIECKNLQFLLLKNNKIKNRHIDFLEILSILDFLDLRDNHPIKYSVDSTDIDIYELKARIGNRLFIDDNKNIKINDIYANLNAKPIKFNFENLRKCRPYTLPLYIFNKDEYKTDNQLVILDSNQFTSEVKYLDTAIFKSFIYHIYNPNDDHLRWNVPENLLNEFKKYIGAIIFKLFFI